LLGLALGDEVGAVLGAVLGPKLGFALGEELRPELGEGLGRVLGAKPAVADVGNSELLVGTLSKKPLIIPRGVSPVLPIYTTVRTATAAAIVAMAIKALVAADKQGFPTAAIAIVLAPLAADALVEVDACSSIDGRAGLSFNSCCPMFTISVDLTVRVIIAQLLLQLVNALGVQSSHPCSCDRVFVFFPLLSQWSLLLSTVQCIISVRTITSELTHQTTVSRNVRQDHMGLKYQCRCLLQWYVC
jgi:hypothetical protein